MATRNDVIVYYHLNPRLIVVQAPSTEMTMQDLHDTLQDIDDEPANMVYPHLVQSAGKDDLGGGVSVGITLTLRNAQICFARREHIVDSGTCTSNSPIGFTLQQIIDANATFITDGIERGMWVSCNTKGFPCEIVSVDSETQLSVLVSSLGNWETGDLYTIWQTEVCNLSGGNLVAVDFNGNSINPVFPTYATSLTKTSSSSATFSAQQQLEYGTFDGGVHVNLSSAYSGTLYPVGTPQQPVNNFADALTIAHIRGFIKLYIHSSCTIDSGLNFSGIEFVGDSPNKTIFTISAAADVTDCEFTNATIQGVLDGGNVITDCSLLTLTYVEGIIQRCLLLETITLSGGATAFFLDCWSGVPGSQTPTINMGGSGSELAVRNYSGGLKLTNKTGTDPCSIDMNSGQIIIDETVTTGSITLRGVGKWTNETTYSGGATIISELISAYDSQQISFEHQVTLDPINGVSGTAHPRGSTRLPVNNLDDAKIIATSLGFNTINLRNNIEVSGVADGYLRGLSFIGEDETITDITIYDSLVDQCEFIDLEIAGHFKHGSFAHFRDCILNNLSHTSIHAYDSFLHSGHFNNVELDACYLDGDFFIAASGRFSGKEIIFEGDFTSIDMSNIETTISLDIDSGYVLIKNCHPGCLAEFNLRGGELELDSSCTGGDFYIEGYGTLYGDPVALGMNVKGNNLLSLDNMADATWNNDIRSLTSAVSVSGIPDVNVVQVSGEYVRKEDLQGPGSSLTTGAIAQAVWDEILTGATHNIPTSAGRRIRQIAANIVYDGIVTSGTINTVSFDGGASTIDGTYDPAYIYVSAGAGVGQCRSILEYIGATKTAVVDRDWKIIPDATSEVTIVCDAGREHVNEGLARAGTNMTIQLNSLASTLNDSYKGQIVFIRSGTGSDQARRVASYNGSTQIATMSRAWDIIPSSDSAYVMLPTGMISDNCIANAVWSSPSGSLVTDLLTKMAPLLIGTVTGAGTNEEIYTYGGKTVKVYATPEGNVTSVVFS